MAFEFALPDPAFLTSAKFPVIVLSLSTEEPESISLKTNKDPATELSPVDLAMLL